MSSINNVMLIGRVGRDPEVRSTKNDKDVASFSLATVEKWSDKNSGTKTEKTEWHNIVVFNQGLVKVIEQYVHKGDLIYVHGKLKYRKWTDDKEVERTVADVVLNGYGCGISLLASRKEKDGNGDSKDTKSDISTIKNNGHLKAEDNSNLSDFYSDIDDEIPF